jgi:hypothetical protein
MDLINSDERFSMQRWQQQWVQGGGGLVAVLVVGTIAGSATAQPVPKVVNKHHTLNYGTYLGGQGHDEARGVDFTTDNSVVACGNFKNLQTVGAKAVTLDKVAATAAGKILKMSPDGSKVLNTMTLGDRIDDCQMWRDVSGNKFRDRLVVGGSFGVVVIDPSKMVAQWSAALPGPAGNGKSEGGQTRVSINRQGLVAAVRNNMVSLFDAKGNLKQVLPIDRTFVTDVALDPVRPQLYVVGFSNRKNVNDKNNPVQVPFMYALDTAKLNFQWRTWDYDPNTLNFTAIGQKIDPATGQPKEVKVNNMADSRLYRVAVGGDGRIAVLGENAGGNTVFRWNGKGFPTAFNENLYQEFQTQIKYDAYSDTYNSKSPHLLYFAKVDAQTGVVLAGQNAVARLPEPKPGQTGLANAFRAKDGSIAVDRQGNLLISGIAAYGTPERDENKFNGEAVATYQGDDMIFLQVSADLKQRLRWTPFGRGTGGGGDLNAVAVKDDRVALFGSSTFGTLMTTEQTPAPHPFDPLKTDNARDAYLGVLSQIN